MMSLSLYLAFCAATTVLILIPGPNVSLIVALYKRQLVERVGKIPRRQ